MKAQGADIRMIYSCADALKIAQQNPQNQVVFMAIGFETTTPPTADVIKRAQSLGLTNFTVFCNHVLTPSAISHILQSPEIRALGLVRLDGFIGPAHVSTIIGSKPYEYFTEEFQKPVVIAGFEPLDVMQAILMLIRQINNGRSEVENEFTRAVLPQGNLKAQMLVAEVFELRRFFEWRGLGIVPYSALRIKSSYAEFDAEQRFELPSLLIEDNKACECGLFCAVLNIHAIAKYLVPYVHRRILSVHAWCHPKALARRIIVMVDFVQSTIIAIKVIG